MRLVPLRQLLRARLHPASLRLPPQLLRVGHGRRPNREQLAPVEPFRYRDDTHVHRLVPAGAVWRVHLHHHLAVRVHEIIV